MTLSKHNANDIFIGTETGYLLKIGESKIAPINDHGKKI